VGIMLYHIITGTYPFRADNPQGILAGHLMRTPIPMSDNPKGVEIPEKLEALVMRCLSKQAPDRYENMLVLADALSHFVEDPSPVQIEMPVGYQSGSGQLDPSTLAGVQYQSLSGGHWALMGALITSILGVLALIGYVIWLRFDDGKSDRAESQRDNDEAEKVEQKHDPTAEPVRTQAPIPEEEPTGLDPAEAQDAPPAPASQTDLSPTREETRSSRPTSDQTELRTASQPRPAHNDSADDRQPASEGYDNLDFSIDEMEVIDPWQD
jgi:serine/threonine protein kinase